MGAESPVQGKQAFEAHPDPCIRLNTFAALVQYIVDDQWRINDNEEVENDTEGNQNNVLREHSWLCSVVALLTKPGCA